MIRNFHCCRRIGHWGLIVMTNDFILIVVNNFFLDCLEDEEIMIMIDRSTRARRISNTRTINDADDNHNNKEEQLQKNNSNKEKNAHHRKIYNESRGRTISSRYRTLKIGVGFLIFLGVYLYLFNISSISINEDIITTGGDEDRSNNLIAADRGLGRKPSIYDEKFQLAPLRPIDYEQYTIRINAWRRPEQLVVSVKHHASCPGVKQIQIIWCDKENDPPKEILDMMTTGNNSTNNKIVIERHVENSLNERFNIIEPTQTLGILSIDDDVLRPCEAIDSGFFKWIKSPHRMVGFDARNHVENEDGSWEYGYLSTTKKENKYSLSLTRYCFIHRDYMTQYMSSLPKTILDTVENYFNCEDIAMTLMISSQTQGQPPLLADLWAMNSMIKLDVKAGISGGSSHKKNRDNCVDYFTSLLGLKDDKEGNNVESTTKRRLKTAQWIHNSPTWGYECGAKEDENKMISYTKSLREIDLEQTIERWRSGNKKDLQHYLITLISKAGHEAKARGLIASK